jgi:hypothetical protein
MVTQAATASNLAAETDRRRSQRIPVQQPLEVAWHLGDGTYVSAKAHTEEVSAHGARLRVDRSLPERSVIAIRHAQRDDWALARVLRCPKSEGVGWLPVAVELAVANDTFWGQISWSGM